MPAISDAMRIVVDQPSIYELQFEKYRDKAAES